MASTLVVNVLDLLRRPGSEKTVAVTAKAEIFDFADSRIDVAADVEISISLESSSTGIIATGEAHVEWKSVCRRCLRPVGGLADAQIDEAFSKQVPARHAAPVGEHASAELDTEPIVGDQIDFTLIVREAILLAVPDAPLCRTDCKGLCPQCGADRATVDCGCVTEVRDERWAALDALRGQLDDTVE
jgi:uncharacterized protein